MPRLKAEYETLNDIPESIRDFYESENDKYVLKVDGMIHQDSVKKLQLALDAQRRETGEQKKVATNWSALKQSLQRDDLTPEVIAEVFTNYDKLKADLAEITKDERRAIDVAVAERVQSLNQNFEGERTKFSEALKAANERGDKYENIYRDNLFSKSIEETIKDLVHPTAVTDVVYRAKLFGWKLTDDGNVVAVNNRGEPIYSSLKPDQTITLDEWVRNVLYKDAPHVFKSSTGTGDTSKPGFAIGSLKRSNMDQIAKTKFISEHGLDAFKKLPE